jgi:hypothetical protein
LPFADDKMLAHAIEKDEDGKAEEGDTQRRKERTTGPAL